MVDNLRRDAEPQLLAESDLALKDRLKIYGSDDKDVMWRSYDHAARESHERHNLGSKYTTLNNLRKKKIEVFCNIDDEGDVHVNDRFKDIIAASVTSPQLIPINKPRSKDRLEHTRQREGLILPPKKTIKLEPSDVPARPNHSEYSSTDCSGNASVPSDVPINLCIKSEQCDSEKVSDCGSINANFSSSSHRSGDVGLSVRSSIYSSLSAPLPTSPVGVHYGTDTQPESGYDISGSSQESVQNGSHNVLSGSSQDSALGASHYALSASSPLLAHNGSTHNLSASSQDSANHSLPVWCEDEHLSTSGFIENTAQLTRLERRRQQNREAARRLREKRKKCLDRVYEERREFQTKLLNLQHENELLRKKAESSEGAQKNNTELEIVKRENQELREQLKEHHECKLRVEKLQREGIELRAELMHALRENSRLRRVIEIHKEQCDEPF